MKVFFPRQVYRGPLRAVVLDWAGTTVDFGCCAPTAVFQEVFRREGITISTAEARGPMGMHKQDHLRAICQLPEVREQWQRLRRGAPTEEDVVRMYEQFIPLQLETVAHYAEPIDGCLKTMSALRRRGIKIGSNTGYDRAMMEVLTAAASRHGYAADEMVCSSDVPRGRPAPWMALEVARRLDVYPLASMVKVDDTVPGIAEGRNAGMWTVGVAATGNEVGLTRDAFSQLEAGERSAMIEAATQRLAGGGAHYVIDGIGDLMLCIEDIERRLAEGETPHALPTPVHQ